MQVIATGKWSKSDEDWQMVVALRRPPLRVPRSPTRTPDRPKPARRARKRPRK